MDQFPTEPLKNVTGRNSHHAMSWPQVEGLCWTTRWVCRQLVQGEQKQEIFIKIYISNFWTWFILIGPIFNCSPHSKISRKTAATRDKQKKTSGSHCFTLTLFQHCVDMVQLINWNMDIIRFARLAKYRGIRMNLGSNSIIWMVLLKQCMTEHIPGLFLNRKTISHSCRLSGTFAKGGRSWHWK